MWDIDTFEEKVCNMQRCQTGGFTELITAGY
jgi:hypothetical protein